MRQYAQRMHIIRSLDRLCYQLFALSFFLAPSLLQLLARATSQYQFPRPRDVDEERSLKFWLFIILCANTGSLLNHVTYRPSEANKKGIILDFIGMATLPSKIELLTLDLLIVLIQIILVVISYETSVARALPDAVDLLMPSDTDTADDTSSSKSDRNIPVVHLRLRRTLRRIIDPAPQIPVSDSDIPLPGTTPSFIFPSGELPLRFAIRIRTRAQARRDAAAAPSTLAGNESRQTRTVPGGLDVN